jgi:hypothetical protein
MGGTDRYQEALDTAARMLGAPLVLPLGPGEPESGADRAYVRRLLETGLDDRGRPGTRAWNSFLPQLLAPVVAYRAPALGP